MTAEVLDVIERLRMEGRDIVVVTHHMAFARRIADCVAFLGDGQILEWGSAAELFEAPKRAETRAFLAKVLRF